MNVLKTWFQGADDDARQIHREVSGEPHVLPLLPHPMAYSQENTQDVMSSPIISHDAQGETQENLFAGVDVVFCMPPPNSPNPEHMLVIGNEFTGFESDLPETPEDLEWIPHGSIPHGSQGLYILMGVIRDVSQPSTSHQKPLTALDLPVMSRCLPLRISRPPQCAPDGTDDSQWVADETESLPDESQQEIQDYDGEARAIALRWARDEIKDIYEAEALINEVHALQDAQSSAMPLQKRSHLEVVQSIHADAPEAKKPRGLTQPYGD